MPLGRKIQTIGAVAGGLLTNLIGLLLVFGAIDWSPEQIGAVTVTYSSVIIVAVAGAYVASGQEPPGPV